MNNLATALLENLPAEVIADVKRTLGAFNEARVWKKEGKDEYRVVAHVGLSASKDDWNYVDTFTSEEIFTPNERILNYVRNFRDFPFRVGPAFNANGGFNKELLTYKGDKDYKAIRSDWTEVTLNENGDLAFS